MTLDDILSREAVAAKQRGDGFVGFCPAHNDGEKSGNRSLSIAERGGKLMLFCFAGCSFGDIVDALGGPTREPDPKAFVGRIKPAAPAVDVTTTYVYQGGRVVRTDKAGGGKDFLPYFRPDGRPGYPDDWKGLPRRPLYHLDEIVPFDLIWIAEGEKSADAIRAAGGTAVCSPSGSSQAHLADWTPLAGCEVAIWPDNDEPGAKYLDVVKTILEPIAASIKVVDVAALVLPDKGDAADVLDLNLDEITFLDPNKKRWTMSDLEWSEVEYPDQTEIVGGGILVAGSLALLAGEGGAGKTTLAWQVAETIAYGGQGGHFLGFKVARGQVCYLLGEGHGKHIRARVNAARQALGVTEYGQIHVVRSDIPRVGPELLEALEEIDGDVTLTVLDTYGYFSDAQENDATDIKQKLINPLRAISQKTGSAFLLVHHLAKKTEYKQGKDLIRGSTAWFGDCDSVLRFTSPNGANEPTRILDFDKLKHGPPLDPIAVEFDFTSATVSVSSEDVTALRRPGVRAAVEYCKKHGEGTTEELRIHLLNECGLHKSAAAESLGEAVKMGLLVRKGRGLYKLI